MWIFLLILLSVALLVIGMVVSVQLRDTHPKLSHGLIFLPLAVIVILKLHDYGNRWLDESYLKDHCSTIKPKLLILAVDKLARSDTSFRTERYRGLVTTVVIRSISSGRYGCVVEARDGIVIKAEYTKSEDIEKIIDGIL